MAAASPPLSPSTPNPPQTWQPRPSRTYTRDQLEQYFGNPHDGTLTGSVDDPQRISRIVIFNGQHPAFPPEIFIKSNLHLAFGTPLRTLQSVPIPLFQQTPCPPSSPGSSGGLNTKDKLEFGGWYVIDNVQRIERRSPELSTRLEAKWAAKKGRAGQRTPEAWNKCVSVDWALISLRRVSDKDCPLEQPSPTGKALGAYGDEGGVGLGSGGGTGFGQRQFSIDDGAPEDYFPNAPPPTRRTTQANVGFVNTQVEEYFIPPPPPPPSRVPTTLGANTNSFDDAGLDCKLMDESIISISKRSEEGMSESEYGNVTRSEIEDCDRWSELSTGPVDRQWTVVYEEKDELI